MSAILRGASQCATGTLVPATTALLCCDIQDRFRPIIHNIETVISQSNFLVKTANILEIPVVVTEHYPKAFGRTIADVLNTTPPTTYPTFEKKLFSMMTTEVQAHIDPLKIQSFVLFGLETHVCVQQTALDLISQGHNVHIIVDAVSSQSPLDRQIALNRLQASGCFLTTAQSIVFMLMGTAEHPNFKEVSKLVVGQAKVRNEFNEELLHSLGKGSAL